MSIIGGNILRNFTALMARFACLKDIVTRVKRSAPSAVSALCAVNPNLGIVWRSEEDKCRIGSKCDMFLNLLARNTKCTALRVISRSGYGIVIGTRSKHLHHCAILQRIRLIANHYNCIARLNNKHHKLRFCSSSVDVLRKGD